MLLFVCVVMLCCIVVIVHDFYMDNKRMQEMAKAYQESRPAMTFLSPEESFEVRRKHLQLVQQGLIDAMNKPKTN